MRGALYGIIAWSAVLLLGSFWVMGGCFEGAALPFIVLCVLCIAVSTVGLRTQRWGWAPFWVAVTLHGSLTFASWHAADHMNHAVGTGWALTIGLG
ncbi:hypothetical protein HQ560_05800 [bacterium]|nr:hypothetical protein [bacterium]